MHERPRPGAPDDGPVRLYGIHAVEAALKNPARQLRRLLLTDNAERRLTAAIAARAVKPQRAAPRDLDRLLGPDTVHQGVLLETELLPEPALNEVAEQAENGGPLVVLDQVTDPHNVGAILRSAAVFGASALVMTRRHSPPLSGALAKSASGALEVVPVVLVPNLARALAELADMGFWRLGLDGEADALIDDQPLAQRTALVLGSEGRGLRRLTRDLCDTLCRIGAAGSIASLNVSNAAAVALYVAAVRRRPS
ncbi:MAG TPA: 23S rRNA (guanosine(2251)-2'-O)-methyltransferase RlmB [Devosia sp.]|nr:23S rRNA (guanosine(2251)-2'-O)-methyltransferase RlmB [Devosia sp.]